MYGVNATDVQMKRWHQLTLYISAPGGRKYQGNKSFINYTICSNLPESFGYSVGSDYENPLGGILGGSGLVNLAMQLATGGSGAMKLATVKVWKSSKPMSFSLKIPVVDDGWSTQQNGAYTNFMEALEVLGTMCLPTYGTNGKGGLKEKLGSFSYKPPPNPVSGNISWTWNGTPHNLPLSTTSGKIMVQLGGMLLVDNCILKNIKVDYPNTKAMIKHQYLSNTYVTQNSGKKVFEYLTPIIANLTLDFEVPYALVSQDFSKMLWLNSNQTGNYFSADINKMVEGVKDTAKQIMGSFSSDDKKNSNSTW